MVFTFELQPTELPLQAIKWDNLFTLLQSYILCFTIKQIKLTQIEKYIENNIKDSVIRTTYCST